MNDKIVQHLKNIETHAEDLMKVPSGEQYIGNIQEIVAVALMEIKRTIEDMDRLTTVEE